MPKPFRFGRLFLAGALTATSIGFFTVTQPVRAHVPINPGWTDPHSGWPARPSGLTQINSVFGGACNGSSNVELYQWLDYWTNTYYPVRFHDKLGTAGAIRSENLNNNVAGHHYYNGQPHHDVRAGIYGYNCRKISGSTKWSTHAWGIAVDTNSASSPNRCGGPYTVTQAQVNIWTSHNWVWGLSFCDPMHFQYASNY